MGKARHFIRDLRPNRIGAGKLAIVALTPNGEPEAGAWFPFRATQIIGGRRWSLSVILRGDVTSYQPRRAPISRERVEEALDLLQGEHTDPGAAAALLHDALHAH